jgi:hypothetical protein
MLSILIPVPKSFVTHHPISEGTLILSWHFAQKLQVTQILGVGVGIVMFFAQKQGSLSCPDFIEFLLSPHQLLWLLLCDGISKVPPLLSMEMNNEK